MQKIEEDPNRQGQNPGHTEESIAYDELASLYVVQSRRHLAKMIKTKGKD